MELYLVQHGDATPKEVNPERPLTEKGALQVTRVGAFLKRTGICVDTILHSGKKRAHQTARIIANSLNPKCSVIQRDDLSPNDPIDEIYKELSEMDGDLMIVGHLPFLAKLASRLLLDSEDKDVIGFRQGGVLLLTKNEGTWKVKWFLTPELCN